MEGKNRESVGRKTMIKIHCTKKFFKIKKIIKMGNKNIC